MDKIHYVVGFCFSEDKERVVLIIKKRPEWQKYLLNGVGGKKESDDESFREAIVREFKEETGVETQEDDWKSFCYLEGSDYLVYCFKCFNDGYFNESDTTTDEPIYKVQISSILQSNHKYVSNLVWLLYMALDENYGKDFIGEIFYK